MLKKDWPLAHKTVEQRVIQKCHELSGNKFRGTPVKSGVSFYLENVFELELLRLKNKNDSYYRQLVKIQKQLNSNQLQEQEALELIIRIYLKEITGHLNPTFFKLLVLIIPKLFSFVFVRKSAWKMLRNTIFEVSIKPFFRFSGNIELVQKLSQKGTFIVAPTHSSNLDSPLLGLAFHEMGLPPLIYGAGLNLFSNHFFGFFMNRLGAYKVDRLKKCELYKLVLKQYCTYSLEAGYNNLFFPGGTRARSGEVEKKLKTGLLSCGLEAYCNQVKKGEANHKIFIIPCTLNYHSVLEAPTLIGDYLSLEDKKRFIISDDESSRPNEIFYFLRKSSKFFLHFGDPLDPFGNLVNENGESIDTAGNIINIEKRVEEVKDDQNLYKVTQNLAGQLVQDYQKHNVILNTHVVAKVIYNEIIKIYPEKSINELCEMDFKNNPIDLSLLYDPLEKLTDQLRKMHQLNKIVCDEAILIKDITEIFSDGLDVLTHFHWPSAIRKHYDKIMISNFKLLFFYQNKIDSAELVEC